MCIRDRVFRSRRCSQKYGCQSEIPRSQAYSSVSQSVFPGPNPLIPQRPQNPSVFPEGHRQGRWPAASRDSAPILACMRMLNRIDRLILLLILGTKRRGCGRRRRALLLQWIAAWPAAGAPRRSRKAAKRSSSQPISAATHDVATAAAVVGNSSSITTAVRRRSRGRRNNQHRGCYQYKWTKAPVLR